MTQDIQFLNRAIAQARQAFDHDEVPVGAIIVINGEIIAEAHNQVEQLQDATSHAEIMAIRRASKTIGRRLDSATLYTTLEPCPMCAGAIIQSRIKRVVFGAYDLRWGAAQTKFNLFEPGLFNHTVEISYLPNQECETILKTFFKQKRQK